MLGKLGCSAPPVQNDSCCVPSNEVLPPRLQLQPVSVCLYIGKKELKDSPLSSKEHNPIALDMEYNLIGTDFVKPTPRSLSSDPKGHAVLSKALRTESE